MQQQDITTEELQLLILDLNFNIVCTCNSEYLITTKYNIPQYSSSTIK